MNFQSEHAVRRLFQEHGYEVVKLYRGKHWRVTARRDSRVGLFVVPTSPSSNRSWINLLSQLRRGGLPQVTRQ